MAPYLLLFVVFVLAPIVYGLWISLHEYDFTLPERPFVGLGNYTGLLDGSSFLQGRFPIVGHSTHMSLRLRSNPIGTPVAERQPGPQILSNMVVHYQVTESG